MIRFAVPPIGGQEWFGGWMYMRNLVRALATHGDPAIEICVFVGEDKADDPFVAELRGLNRTRVVVNSLFDGSRFRGGTIGTLVTGRRAALLDVFRSEEIDVALDWATYYGWRCEIPTIAWIPDFQHRALPHLFGKTAWYRRDAGFRLQIAASKKILLSSEAAEADCHSYYPSARGKTHVARFAVPVDDWPEPAEAEQLLEAADIPRDFVFLPNQLWHHKNHSLAIEAAGILAQRGAGRVIVATGRGSDPRHPGYRSELINRIEKVGASDNFLLLDGVSHDLVKAMMLTTNALLNPSRFEGWSTPVEEAKAVGTPMLLSDIAVHREQAPEAIFFDADDPFALAAAIQASPKRNMAVIAHSMANARALADRRQQEFSHSLSLAVIEAATGLRARR